jgi:hypothetical protein
VLHNLVVAMSVYADVCVMRKTEVHNAAEYSMRIWITGYAMNYMIG